MIKTARAKCRPIDCYPWYDWTELFKEDEEQDEENDFDDSTREILSGTYWKIAEYI